MSRLRKLRIALWVESLLTFGLLLGAFLLRGQQAGILAGAGLGVVAWIIPITRRALLVELRMQRVEPHLEKLKSLGIEKEIVDEVRDLSRRVFRS